MRRLPRLRPRSRRKPAPRDFHLVQRQPDKSEILLEQLRELQNDLTYKPYEARWRVAVIENAQEANASAANSFLKTLEERCRW